MENAALMDDVLERVRREGALGSADFVAPDGFQQRSWWGWKPAKQALEALFDHGKTHGR